MVLMYKIIRWYRKKEKAFDPEEDNIQYISRARSYDQKDGRAGSCSFEPGGGVDMLRPSTIAD